MQAWSDLDKQWFPTLYKIYDEELEVIIDDCASTWREPVILQEVSTGPLADVPIDLVPVTDPEIPHDLNVEWM